MQPGYPGYRGYVTGLAGAGEAACLHDLVAQHPDFDQAREDAANLAAARQLGLAGSPTDWTWENWMAIEGERGLPMSCYACILLGQEPPPAARMSVDPNDPRLLLGGYHTQTALLRATANLGYGSSAWLIDYVFHSDDVFRAMVGALSPGSHDAPEMLQLEQALIDSLGGPGPAVFFDNRALWATIVDQGGYAPTPANARLEDQTYLVEEGAAAVGIWMSDRVRTGFFNAVDMWKGGWLADVSRNGPDISFGQWLKDHDAQI